MAQHSKPRRGSMGYSPRKRASSERQAVRSWAGSGVLGFAGYKVGMTHVMLVDYRPTSLTSGQEVMVPVTVVETPPMKVVGMRFYAYSPYGMRSVGEIWSDDLQALDEVICLPKKKEKKEYSNYDEIRLIAHTQPYKVTGIPKKVPELFEIGIGGELKEKQSLAESLLGKEISVRDVFREGEMVDVIGVTKGKGFQGHIKRWGVKLLAHKNSKHRRMIGTLGPWLSWVRPSVPQAGQMGFHRRTEYNKRILKIGDKPEEINPVGGFIRYGFVRNDYVILHGSILGCTKRLVFMRKAIRYLAGVKIEKPQISYISTTSRQGVR
ncbi:MAG: 50S ribosomal protein L3 [Candidatus Thermoplasmatota archaeon]